MSDLHIRALKATIKVV